MAWASQACAASISITTPTTDQIASGLLTFAATGSGIASVEFDLGSLRIGTATAMPFSVSWNTGYAGDGNYEVEAIGRDSSGHPVASAVRAFVINNHGNALNVITPDLSSPISGTVTLDLSGKDSQYWPAFWMVYIDGELVDTIYTDNADVFSKRVTARVDTTRYPNGEHELYVGLHSDYNPGSGMEYHSYRAGYDRLVDIENGATLMDVAANYSQVYLQPNKMATLSCRDLYTNGSSTPCSAPAYDTVTCSGDPLSCSHSATSVLAVNSRGAISAGNGEGFATIQISDRGKSSQTYVWVRDSLGVPHFAGNGRMLTSYRAGQSLFVLAPFDSDIPQFQANASLTKSLRSAGINTLTQGIYRNPRSATENLTAWKSDYDGNNTVYWKWAADNGFHLLFTGDDITRDPCRDAWWSAKWPAAKPAIQYAFQQAAASGVAIGVEMVDEVSAIWGSTPYPTTDWAESCGIIPKTWFKTLREWIAAASPSLPIAWPSLGIAPASTWGNWDGANTASDYGSHYWDTFDLRHTYVWSAGVRERSYWMSRVFYQRQPYAMLDRPQMMLRGGSSADYLKETVSGAYFTPPTDILLAAGDNGPTLTGGIMTAAALGSAGVRLYYWDNAGNTSTRASDPRGTEETTGFNSFATDPVVSENWQAISNAGNALALLTPYLLANTLNSPAYGRNIITAARQGANGRMLMIVNGWDYARTIPVDLTPYTYGGAITRYVVSTYGNTRTDLTGSVKDNLALHGGETAAYLFARGK